ncbi:FAD/NAD(P)-binding protein [Intrasporangium sp. DVR]|uniref:FAD/NAD(P)-binding protein n=1 Tax=Intrasporangium sp. DVR TaxID=3127867 RepID=UPI00313A63B5
MTALTALATGPRPPEPDPMLPRLFRVVSTRRDTADTHTLVLEAVDGGTLPFRPGQFTMLHSFGVGEVPISISGDPAHPELLQHTVRDVGSVTASICAAGPGTVLGVRGPFGTGWDVADGKGGDVVLVAGGIGLVPLRPAILEVLADRSAYGRVALLYGTRTPEDVVYPDELRTWAAEHDVAVGLTVDHGSPGWTGAVGLVSRLVSRARFDALNALALVCGPEIMMRAIATGLRDRGVSGTRVRLSMERTMKCGIGLCGHCQLREHFVCLDGPVFDLDRISPLLTKWEL